MIERTGICKVGGEGLTCQSVGESTGQLELDIPSFVKLDHDAEGRKAVLTVEDKEQKKQMEMWGMLSPHYPSKREKKR